MGVRTGSRFACVTVTSVVPAGDVQPFIVIASEYVPAFASSAFAIVGFCSLEVKLFGPLH